MADINCEACETLRQEVPQLICNGFDDDMCTSLQNDTGLEPQNGHNDCTDLNNLNDCLVGNEEAEVDLYEVCDWKPFMKQFIPNLWTVLKAIICAICGIWTNIHNLWNKINELINKIDCVYNGAKNLISTLNATTQGQAFVRYFRDNSGTGNGYLWKISKGASHTLDIYTDANVDNPGSRAADRDYVVIIQNCTDIHNSNNVGVEVTYFSSGDTRGIDAIRKRQAQHPTYNLHSASMEVFSWTTSGAVLIRKGEHLKVNAHVYAGSSGNFRLHQFVITWIPVNISGSLDPSAIIPC